MGPTLQCSKQNNQNLWKNSAKWNRSTKRRLNSKSGNMTSLWETVLNIKISLCKSQKWSLDNFSQLLRYDLARSSFWLDCEKKTWKRMLHHFTTSMYLNLKSCKKLRKNPQHFFRGIKLTLLSFKVNWSLKKLYFMKDIL